MIPMATVTKKIFTCDVCGNANDVQRWAFGFDGKRYEIDLCPKDGNGLSKVVARYASKARKVTARKNQSRNGDRPRSPRAAAATDDAASAPSAAAGSQGQRHAAGEKHLCIRDPSRRHRGGSRNAGRGGTSWPARDRL